MSTLDHLLGLLYRLADGCQSSRVAFDIPESGFAHLAKVLSDISATISGVENRSLPPEGLSDLELRYAAEATEAAACAANAAAEAADTAARAASLARDERVARRAVYTALRAAGAAYRAAGAARGAAMAAESLPPGAQLLFDPEVARAIIEESEQFNSIYQFLFKNDALQSDSSLYGQFSLLGQVKIREAGGLLLDDLVDLLYRITSPGTDAPLESMRAIICSGNQKLKALLRQYALGSAAFRDPDVLQRVINSHDAGMLGLDMDAGLRARNMALRPDIFEDLQGRDESGATESETEDDDEETEILPGQIPDDADEEFLFFPAKFNGISIKPLIDTGGGCNIVNGGWLKEHGFEVDEKTGDTVQLLMADGSTSKESPVFKAKWSFDDRKKAWVDVQFIVIEGYKYEALIGLPFLKHTQTIHNSQGRLVFPEFKKVHGKKEAIPVYDFKVKPSM